MSSLCDRIIAPPLELHRFNLKRLDDFIAAVEVSFSELHQWMSWASAMPDREDFKKRIGEDDVRFDNDEAWQYFLIESSSDLVVGGAGLRPVAPEQMAIGYWVRTDRTGRGYAQVAARALTSAAFSSPLSVARVEISMDHANLGSRAVPKKLGFQFLEERERDVITPGQTGKGEYWIMERAAWATLEAARHEVETTAEGVQHR